MPNESEQLTEKQLGFAYWYITHKLQLKKLGIGLLIAFDVITVGFGLWGYADYFLISWNRDLALRRDMPYLRFSHELVRSLGPQALNPVSADIFVSGAGKYDFLTKLQNANTDWYADFKYKFVGRGGETAEATGFILPREEKFVSVLGAALASSPVGATFQFTDIAWHRVNRHVIRDYEAWRSERLNMILTNVIHNPSLNIDSTVGRTSFDTENRSAFGFWKVGFSVVLLRGSSPAAANHVVLDNFESGEKRHVDVNWFESLPGTTGVDVRPEVNIFDADVYMPPRVQ